jgi:transcriptional regulator with XRE-family HTH domain
MAEGGAFPHPPEGQLIERVRRLRDLTLTDCAQRAGISTNRWRYIVRGYRTGGKPNNARPGTWAALARIVGVEAEAFDVIGRTDVGQLIRKAGQTDTSTVNVLDTQQALLERLLRELRDTFGAKRFNAAVRAVTGR